MDTYESNQLYDEAMEAVWNTFGGYPRTEQLYENMCYWLQGWYFHRGWRVRVTWHDYGGDFQFIVENFGEVTDEA